MANTFFQSSWGQIKLWLGRASTDNSRTIVVHSPSSGDVHTTTDRGLVVRRTRVELLFDEMDGESETPSNRFRRFKAAVDSGAEAVFTHPIDGSYVAKVGPFTYDLEPGYDYPTNVEVEFIASDEVDAVSPAGAGSSAAAGEQSVTQAADDLDAALAAVDMENDVTDDAREAVDTWTDAETVPTRAIIVATADISDKLATMIEDLGLEDDLELFDVYRSTILFGDAVRAAAMAATSEVPSVFVLRVQSRVAILPLMAKIYGGAEAESRARQVEELNDIRTPGWFGPGELLCPTKAKSHATF